MVEEGAAEGDRESGAEDLSLTEFRQAHFRRVLEACGDDIEETAHVLGVTVEEVQRVLHGGF